VIAGTGLADPTTAAVLQDSTQGLPTTLNGASVQVTSGGTTVTPAFYYTSFTQLALVLPSKTPLGTAQITVSYNGQTSAPFTFQVVQAAPGFASYDGTGTGLGAALNPTTYVPYSYADSIPPGATVVLYGSGLGADAATDTKYVSGPFNINNLAHIYVGGVDALIPYQGSFGYPGLNQVNVTIPASAPTGCNVPVVGVTAAGIPTNTITLPIGNGICSDAALGINGNLLLQPTINTAQVGILLSPGTGEPNVAFESFTSYNGSDFLNALTAESLVVNLGIEPGAAWVSLNGCLVQQSAISPNPPVGTGLNGGSVTVSGPAGGAPLAVPGAVALPSSFLPAAGGSFTFQGYGGPDVGAFTANFVAPSQAFIWTNESTTAEVTRSSGLPITWIGGASNSYVQITAIPYSGGPYLAPGATAILSCTVPTSAGQFTVPSYVLAALPAGPYNLYVSNENNFTALGATGAAWGSLFLETWPAGTVVTFN
jgi:uncharacterized protein (TIGR03437 family)